VVVKYQPYSRRELRAGFKTWLARNRMLVALILAGAALLLVVETVVIVALFPDGALKGYVLGVTHSVVVAAVLYALHLSFLAHDREAILHLRGAWGEGNTRSELERARRKRLIWGWVDSVALENGDIDHLVVTRAGGLVAIDSKWRNQSGPADQEAMARAAHKARLRAEGIVRTLLTRERGAHRARSSALSVTPLLVLWGAAQHSVPDGTTLDGIEVIGGRRLLTWLRHLDGDDVEEAAARDLLARVEAFRASAWDPGSATGSV